MNKDRMEEVIKETKLYDKSRKETRTWNLTTQQSKDLANALRSAGYKHESESLYKIQLESWQEAFGTTQLTHALDRLKSAENKARPELDEEAVTEIIFQGRVSTDTPRGIAHAICLAYQQGLLTKEGDK